MARKVLLDSGPIGEVTHPRAGSREPVRRWLASLLDAGASAPLPEIVDYEHRRKLLHLGATRQVRRLDEFGEIFGYEPLSTRAMRRASELWADARRKGTPTASEEALDVDVILAAQAQILEEAGHEVVVATVNPRHLSLFVDARPWSEIRP